ncbi:hypothetical protein VNI00_018111 [Paramarasmius palmivorus]|uniref:WD40 repeat-like protein n=1 Tax=Paramarasmius palmivorus TaxID=297713 RepID=A0AAW0B2T4_9AGAR
MFSREYKAVKTLSGVQNAVLSLSFSTGGLFLAAAGLDGLTVWDLRTLTQTLIPEKYNSPKDPNWKVSVLSWIFFEKGSRHVLLLGGMKGDLTAWHWNDTRRVFEHFARASPNAATEQIMSIDVYHSQITSKRAATVAISCVDGSVAVWKLSSVGDFTLAFSTVPDPNIMPKVVKFDKDRNLHVFAYTAGTLLCLDRTGKVKSSRNTGLDRIGAVAFDRYKDSVIVNNGKDFRVLSITNLTHQQTLPASAPTVVLYPKQVTFIEDGNKVVGGTDSGHAAIYDLSSGKIVQRLEYPKGGLVQVVASITGDKQSFIALAGSTVEQPADVLLFKRKHAPALLPSISAPISRPTLHIMLAVLITMLSCHVYYIWTPHLLHSVSSFRDLASFARYMQFGQNVTFPPATSPPAAGSSETVTGNAQVASHSTVMSSLHQKVPTPLQDCFRENPDSQLCSRDEIHLNA